LNKLVRFIQRGEEKACEFFDKKGCSAETFANQTHIEAERTAIRGGIHERIVAYLFSAAGGGKLSALRGRCSVRAKKPE